MDPMMMMMLASLAKEAMQPPKPIMPTGPAPAPPAMRPVENIPSFDFTGAGVGGAGVPTADTMMPQEGGAFTGGGGTPAVAPSPLEGLSRLGADVTSDDVEIGRALLGGPGTEGLSTTGQGMETAGEAPELSKTSTISPPPVTPPVGSTLGSDAGAAIARAPGAADPAKAGFDFNALFKGLGGVKAPPPVTPIMHGGNTGGARPPEVSAKMGSSIAVNPIWQLLFGSQQPKGLSVPPLGQLLRGA